MNISVIEKEEIKVVGLAWNGPYEQHNHISNLFSMLKERAHEIQYKKNISSILGLYHYRETEITHYAAFPVEKLEEIPKGMAGFTIPKKSYVFCRNPSTAEAIQGTCREMVAWMEEYGYEQDDRALCLIVYKSDLETPNKMDSIEIYLPIKKY